MPLYKYRAIGADGEKIEGTYSTGDRTQLINMLRGKNNHLVDITEVSESKTIEDFNFFKKVKGRDIAVFCRQFYAMLNAGVTIIKCLDILQQQTENKRLKVIVGKMYDDVQKGAQFSEALRNHKDVFPDLLINMVESGEVSGTLDNIMNRMANHFEKDNKLKNKIKGTMVYPIVLSIVAVLVVIFLLTFILPTFMGLFTSSGIILPLPTRILMTISDIIKGYWYLIGAVVIGVVYVVKRYLKSDKGRLAWDRTILRLPVFKSTVTKMISARFTRTLSTLLASGVSLLQAMEIVAKVVGNKVAADGIMNAREDMRRGMDLASPIRKMGIFPPMIDSMIRIGEESGTLDEILGKTADFYDEEVEVALQKLTTLLEPLIILFMAGMIGFIVISMALPMFDMMKTVQ